MNQFIKAQAFLQHLFDQDRLAAKAAAIIEAILAARSPRLSEIAQQMPGSEAANYKAIQRFLQQVVVKALLLRLVQAEAPFVIGDPTEMPRPQARKTSYVGKLKDGKTRGFWLLLLATPFRGRAIPCGFVTYSSKTIAQLSRSRNQYHWAASDQLKALPGDKPMVLDRESSYLELLAYLAAVIRPCSTMMNKSQQHMEQMAAFGLRIRKNPDHTAPSPDSTARTVRSRISRSSRQPQCST